MAQNESLPEIKSQAGSKGQEGKKIKEGKKSKQGTERKEFRELGFLLDVPLQVSVELGGTRVLIKDLLQMREGSVIELDKLVGEPMEVYVNSHLIAQGEAVVVDDKVGLRLTEVVSPLERLEKLK